MAGVSRIVAVDKLLVDRHVVPAHGGSRRGYGWPATLELLDLDDAAPANRPSIRMILCPICESVHELNDQHISRHRHRIIPANSTTQSVRDFYSYYHGKNDSMITDQFNPFMRESTPPLLIDASAETHVAWGRCSFLGLEYDCVTRIYALVMLRWSKSVKRTL